MLHELRVENLLLIERAELRLAPGLNVLTGETGAGKTVLAHALDLLLGGRARPGIVRPGAAEAYVEGVFALPRRAARRARRAAAGGRRGARARPARQRRGAHARVLGGRSGPAADLRELGAALLSFYGQHEHRKLTLASAQLEILDGFCRARAGGRVARRTREAYAHERACARAARRSCASAPARASASSTCSSASWRRSSAWRRARRRRRALEAERGRLRHVEALRGAAAAGAGALDDDGEDGAARRWPLAAAAQALEGVAGVDPALDDLAGRARALALEAEDLVRRAAPLRRGRRRRPAGPLDEVEERLAAARPPQAQARRDGGGRARHAERCRARRDELAGAEEAIEATEQELEAARAELARPAAALTAARARRRRGAGRRGPRAAGRAGHGGRRVRGRARARATGGPTGADEVEFLIAPNPGVPAGPLREIASGGELSRVMLALHGRGRARRGAGDARVRRGRRRHRRPDGPRRRRAAARAGGGPPGASASRTCRRSPRWPTATSRSSRTRTARDRPHHRDRAAPRRGGGRARPHARAPTARTSAAPPSRQGAVEGGVSAPVRRSILGRRAQGDAMPESRPRTRYIFVTGGVVSSLGKGIAAASIGRLLVARGPEGRAAEVRSVHQHRPRDDVAVPARRGVRHRGRRGDRPRPRPLRALHGREHVAGVERDRRRGSTTPSSARSAAATTSAARCRSSRTSRTRSSTGSG